MLTPTSNAVLQQERPDHVPALAEAPLRVLHVLEATLGGTLRYVENIAASMHASPIRFGLAFADRRADSRLVPFLTAARSRQWRTYPVDMRREVSLSGDWSAFRQLRRVLLDFEPDLIHCHSSKAGILGRLAAHTTRPRAAVMYSPHALAVPLGKKYLYIERALQGLVDRFVAVSEGERDDIVRHKVTSAAKVGVVFPSIDPHFFSPRDRRGARVALGLGDGPLVLGLGRLTTQKNPLSFLRILKQLRQQVPTARGLWLGDGDLTADFDETRAALGLTDCVSLVPWQHDVRLYLAAANVLLSTSIYESFGYMVAEALAMQVPVLAPDVSGPRDILADSLPEALYPAGDEDRAAVLLTDLLEDPHLASEQAYRGRKAILARFSPEAMAVSLHHSYQTAVANHARRTS